MPVFPGWNVWTFRAEKAKVEIALYMAVSKKRVPFFTSFTEDAETI